jgi:hypothetical protein
VGHKNLKFKGIIIKKLIVYQKSDDFFKKIIFKNITSEYFNIPNTDECLHHNMIFIDPKL